MVAALPTQEARLAVAHRLVVEYSYRLLLDGLMDSDLIGSPNLCNLVSFINEAYPDGLLSRLPDTSAALHRSARQEHIIAIGHLWIRAAITSNVFTKCCMVARQDFKNRSPYTSAASIRRHSLYQLPEIMAHVTRAVIPPTTRELNLLDMLKHRWDMCQADEFVVLEWSAVDPDMCVEGIHRPQLCKQVHANAAQVVAPVTGMLDIHQFPSAETTQTAGVPGILRELGNERPRFGAFDSEFNRLSPPGPDDSDSSSIDDEQETGTFACRSQSSVLDDNLLPADLAEFSRSRSEGQVDMGVKSSCPPGTYVRKHSPNPDNPAASPEQLPSFSQPSTSPARPNDLTRSAVQPLVTHPPNLRPSNSISTTTHESTFQRTLLNDDMTATDDAHRAVASSPTSLNHFFPLPTAPGPHVLDTQPPASYIRLAVHNDDSETRLRTPEMYTPLADTLTSPHDVHTPSQNSSVPIPRPRLATDDSLAHVTQADDSRIEDKTVAVEPLNDAPRRSVDIELPKDKPWCLWGKHASAVSHRVAALATHHAKNASLHVKSVSQHVVNVSQSVVHNVKRQASDSAVWKSSVCGHYDANALDKMSDQTNLLLSEATYYANAVCSHLSSALTPRDSHLQADSECLVMLVHMLEKLMSHGVKEDWIHVLACLPPAEASTVAARALTQPAPSPIMLIHVLELGWRKQLPVYTGLTPLLEAATHCGSSVPDTLLTAWLHAQFNQRCIAQSLASICARADAVADWTYSWSPLVQSQPLTALIEVLSEVDLQPRDVTLAVDELICPADPEASPSVHGASLRVARSDTWKQSVLSSVSSATCSMEHAVKHAKLQTQETWHSVVSWQRPSSVVQCPNSGCAVSKATSEITGATLPDVAKPRTEAQIQHSIGTDPLLEQQMNALMVAEAASYASGCLDELSSPTSSSEHVVPCMSVQNMAAFAASGPGSSDSTSVSSDQDYLQQEPEMQDGSPHDDRSLNYVTANEDADRVPGAMLPSLLADMTEHSSFQTSFQISPVGPAAASVQTSGDSRTSAVSDLGAEIARSASAFGVLPKPVVNESVAGVSIGVVSVSTGTGPFGSQFTEYNVETVIGVASTRVSRRFRDFMQLHASLGSSSSLPQSWSVLHRASSVTGRARLDPSTVQARHALLDKCLKDVLMEVPHLLAHPKMVDFLGLEQGQLPESLRHCQADDVSASQHSRVAEEARELFLRSCGAESGSSIRMTLTPPLNLNESEGDLVELQQGLCRSCSRPLPPIDPTKNSLGAWGHLLSRKIAARGPRRCHFDGWLYCHKCHHAGVHVIPAQVLAKWDFRAYPVSDNALEYLQATEQQQMLRVNDVNPGLYAYVPLLARVHSQRTDVQKLFKLACASDSGANAVAELCQSAGHRSYLLTSEDQWSLADLEDLSNGVARLPAWFDAMTARARTIASSAILSR